MIVMPAMVAVNSPKLIRSARGPVFVRWERGHDIGFGFTHQLVDGDELKPARRAIDDEGEGEHGALAIAAAIVHENDIAALRIIRLAGRQMIEDFGRRFAAG
jgi:hypothetical protein